MATSPFAVGEVVEVSIRAHPEIPGRKGTVTDTNDEGEYYVTDKETFGHWYGGPFEGGDDSVFIVKKAEPADG